MSEVGEEKEGSFLVALVGGSSFSLDWGGSLRFCPAGTVSSF